METHEYSNGEITILWKPKLCTHSGVCVKTLPQVYNPKARPWIKPENATTEELRNQIAKCPSGALSIKKESNESHETTPSPQKQKKTKFVLEEDVKGSIGTQRFKTSIHWRNGVLITDEPHKIGGQDLGPDPQTLLLSSLIACTLATLRMYIDHKKLDIPQISVSANMHQKIKTTGETITTIKKEISFDGTDIEPEIKNRLMEIAESCPVSKTLRGTVVIE